MQNYFYYFYFIQYFIAHYLFTENFCSTKVALNEFAIFGSLIVIIYLSLYHLNYNFYFINHEVVDILAFMILV